MRKKLKKYFVITPILVMALVILYLVKKYNLLDSNSAIHKIHFPNSLDEIEIARKRLVF